MKKRLFGVAMALCVLLALIPPGAFAADSNCGMAVLKAQKLAPGTAFDADTAEEADGSVKPGDIVVLTIGLKNNGAAAMGIETFGLKLSYDNTKVVPYIGAAPFAENPYQLSPELAGWALVGNNIGANIMMSAMTMSMTAYDIPSGAETALLRLAFSVKDDAPEGVAAFAFDTPEATASDGSLNLDSQPYSLTVGAGAKDAITYSVEDENGEASAVTDISQVAPGSELTVNVEMEAPSDDFKAASVFCAVYARNGKMVHWQVWKMDVSDPLNAAMSGKIRIPENVPVGEIRTFVLSENLVPLRAPAILA